MKFATGNRVHRGNGFTLVELLVVLVVLSLVMAVAVPRFSAGNPALTVRNTGRVLTAGLQMARNMAITENRSVVVSVDRTNRAFIVDGRRRELPRQVSLVRPDQRDDDPRVPIEFRFFPDGSSSGGLVNVVREAHTLTIEVDWITGMITAGRAGRDDA